MDKKMLILGLLLIIALSLAIFFGVKSKSGETDGNMLKKYGVNENFIPDKGMIPDEETAKKIADAVFIQIYGDSINDKKPFDVKFDEEYKVWVVKGTLKANEIGGVPNIIIRKSDGKIIAVWHTK